ncbi:MAG: hypothetical protein IT350_08170 [Deltaproteobacteria bacterium]|nr:hypothetical protein [Deltaproteobacteria bacterium]
MSPPEPSPDPVRAVLRVLRLYGFEFTTDLSRENLADFGPGQRKVRVEFDSATMRLRGSVWPPNDPMVLADLVVMGADLALAATGSPGVATLFPLRPESADGDVDESELEQFDETRRHLDDVHQDHEVDLCGIAANAAGLPKGIARMEIVASGDHGTGVTIRVEPDPATGSLSMVAEVSGVEAPSEAYDDEDGLRPWLAWLPTDGKGRRVGFQLARRFRADGVECRIAAGEDDPDALLAWADRGGARWSVMLGGNELLGRSIEVVDWGADRGDVAGFDAGRIKAVFKDLFEGTPMTTGDVD